MSHFSCISYRWPFESKLLNQQLFHSPHRQRRKLKKLASPLIELPYGDNKNCLEIFNLLFAMKTLNNDRKKTKKSFAASSGQP